MATEAQAPCKGLLAEMAAADTLEDRLKNDIARSLQTLADEFSPPWKRKRLFERLDKKPTDELGRLDSHLADAARALLVDPT